ncbi:unnamed protein product [Closterium sp. NIES-54]
MCPLYTLLSKPPPLLPSHSVPFLTPPPTSQTPFPFPGLLTFHSASPPLHHRSLLPSSSAAPGASAASTSFPSPIFRPLSLSPTSPFLSPLFTAPSPPALPLLRPPWYRQSSAYTPSSLQCLSDLLPLLTLLLPRVARPLIKSQHSLHTEQPPTPPSLQSFSFHSLHLPLLPFPLGPPLCPHPSPACTAVAAGTGPLRERAHHLCLCATRAMPLLTKLYERHKGAGTVWVTLKRSNLRKKPKGGEKKAGGDDVEEDESSAAEYRCVVRATDGKRKISTLLGPREHAKFQAAYALVLKAHMDSLKRKEKRERKKMKPSAPAS